MVCWLIRKSTNHDELSLTWLIDAEMYSSTIYIIFWTELSFFYFSDFEVNTDLIGCYHTERPIKSCYTHCSRLYFQYGDKWNVTLISFVLISIFLKNNIARQELPNLRDNIWMHGIHFMCRINSRMSVSDRDAILDGENRL